LFAGTKYPQGPGRSIEIEIGILIPDRVKATIDRGIERIKEALRDHNFDGLVDEFNTVVFGTVPATPESHRFFRYKHYRENWTTVW